MLVGYLLGSLSPSAFFSVLKKKNLKENGTGNLGATNTMLVFGKKYGVMVMIFDVLKAYFSVMIARILLPKYLLVGVLTGCCAVLGHIFPFYLNFSGGKGVATLAGLLLAIDPATVPILLGLGIVLALVFNYAAAAPVSASLCAPFLVGIRMGSIGVFGLLMVTGLVVSAKHWNNFQRIKDGTEIKVSDFFEEKSHVNE